MQTQIYVGLSAQLALRRQMDTVANNIANMNTTGFRAEKVLFDAHLERTQDRRHVAFVVDRNSYTDMRAGKFETTGNPLDVAVNGDGWLMVETPNGPRYTRDGRLNIDGEGRLVTLDGNLVLDQGGGEIVIPEESGRVEILKDGTVGGRVGEVEQVFGQIARVRPLDIQTMTREASGLYTAPGGFEEAVDAEIRQGVLEGSNVQPVIAMTELMSISRAYEQAKSMVENNDEALRNAVRTIGRID